TNVLPANTSISFYADNTLLAEEFTTQDLQIGETVTEEITIAIPMGTPSNFTLRAVIDGNGDIPETNEGNNEFTLPISLSVIANPAPDVAACDSDNNGFEGANVTVNDVIIIGSQNPAELQLTYHLSQADALNGINPLANPLSYVVFAPSETIFGSLEELGTGN